MSFKLRPVQEDDYSSVRWQQDLFLSDVYLRSDEREESLEPTECMLACRCYRCDPDEFIDRMNDLKEDM